MDLPDKMKEEVGYLVRVSDRRHQELSPEAIYRILKHYVNLCDVFRFQSVISSRRTASHHAW